jgi:hypothetical protein
MESLVPDYGSESEDSDSGQNPKHSDSEEEERVVSSTDEGDRVQKNTASYSMMFPANEVDPLNSQSHCASSSDSDNDGNSDSGSDEESLCSNTLKKRGGPSLENPFRNSKSLKEDSVFQIEFREKEKTESAALERHVKMTPKVGTQTTINGKKICWNYRKGKCRFGHNCTFAHDSDIPLSSEETGKVERKAKAKMQTLSSPKVSSQYPPDLTPSHSSTISPSAYFTAEAKLGGFKELSSTVVDDLDESSETANHHRGAKFGKKRPGLSQTLVPGKKVMKNYFDQKKN